MYVCIYIYSVQIIDSTLSMCEFMFIYIHCAVDYLYVYIYIYIYINIYTYCKNVFSPTLN